VSTTSGRQPRPALDALVISEGAARVVAASGEVDLATAPRLRAAIDEAIEGGSGRVVIDLAEVTFMDSTGLVALVGALRRLTAAGRELHVTCPAGPVRRLFELTRLERTLRVYDTRAEALAA